MIKIKVSNTACYVEGDGSKEDNLELSKISHALSYVPKSAYFSRQSDYIKTQSFLYQTDKYAVFPTGLLPFLMDGGHKKRITEKDGRVWYEAYSINAEIIDNRIDPSPELKPLNLFDEKTGEPLELFEHQKQAIETFLREKRGIMRLATRSGKCCGINTLVRCNDGWKRIKDIQPTQKVKTFSRTQEVSHVYDMNVQNTIILEANTVYSIEVTPEHPLLAVRDGYLFWERADELQKEDYVCLGRQQVEIPEEEDIIARLLGYLIADGGIGCEKHKSKTLCFTNDDEDIKEDFRFILKTLGIKWSEFNNNENGSIGFRLQGGMALKQQLEKWGLSLVNSRHKTLPSYALGSDIAAKEFLRAYLSCEGSSHYDGYKNSFEFSSASKTLVNEVCTLLLAFGIVCNGDIKHIKDHDYYRVRLLGACINNLIDLNLLTAKTKCLQRFPPKQKYMGVDTMRAYGYIYDLRHNNTLTLAEWKRLSKRRIDCYCCDRRHPSYRVLSSFIENDGLTIPDELQAIYDSRPFFAKITNKTKGKSHVYDITVPEDHHFIGNGFYSHNTVCAIALTQVLGLKTLFIVNNITLQKQTIKEFKNKAHIKAGQAGDQIWDVQHVTVATIQTLSKRLKQPEVKAFLKSVEFVIFDEGQHASRTYQQVARMLKNAYYRLSLSATVLMGNKENKLQSMALVGPLIFDMKLDKLVKDKRVAKPTVIFVEIPVHSEDVELNYLDNWVDLYSQGIVNNELRNYILAHAIVAMKERGCPSLALVEQIEHGHNIVDILEEHREGWRVEYISGEHSVEIRDEAKADIQAGLIDVLVTSRIFNEGIDIPLLESVIIAAGYKSVGLTYQRYGRGMNKTEKKDYTTIIDCYDKFNPKLQEHSEERIKFARKSRAFDIEIIKPEQLEEVLDHIFERRRK